MSRGDMEVSYSTFGEVYRGSKDGNLVSSLDPAVVHRVKEIAKGVRQRLGRGSDIDERIVLESMQTLGLSDPGTAIKYLHAADSNSSLDPAVVAPRVVKPPRPSSGSTLSTPVIEMSTPSGHPLPAGPLSIGTQYAIDPKDIDLGAATLVGRGSFGAVYRAKWHLMDVAIKVLHEPDVAAQDEILKELHTMVALGHHANIISLLGAFRDDHGRINVCTTFMEEGTVLDILCVNNKQTCRSPCIARHLYSCGTQPDGLNFFVNDHSPSCEAVRPRLSQLLLYASQAAAGLAHAHDMNVIHRDVACRNLLVDHGHVVVTDFGLARVLQGDAALTQQDYGPLQWMAPEAITERAYSRQSDVWMLGVTIFEMVTYGAMPWAGLDPIQAALRTSSGNTLYGVDQLPPDTPTGLRSLLTRMWAFNPHERPTMAAVHGDLVQLAHTAAEVEAPQPPRALPMTHAARPVGHRPPRRAPAAVVVTGASDRVKWSWGRTLAVAAGAVAVTAGVLWALKNWRKQVRKPSAPPPSKLPAVSAVAAKPAPPPPARLPQLPPPPLSSSVEPLHLRVLRTWNKLLPPP